MRVEFNKRVCSAWFQCIQHWDAFDMDVAEGKAVFEGSEEIQDDLFVRDIGADLSDSAMAAAEACPVDAIAVYDDDGNQINPEN